MNTINFLRRIGMKPIVLVAVMLFFSFQLLDADIYAQTNRKKQKNSFSTLGMREARIRHGITFNLGAGISANLKQPLSIVPAVGLGYCAGQYYGVGNRFMQQSVTYQLGLGLSGLAHGGSYMVHNVIGTFHCSYIGSLDLNPFIYGAAMHFAYCKDEKYFKGAYINFYLRPEIGLAFPLKYTVRTKEVQRVTGSLTYGFNVKTNYKQIENDPSHIKGPNGELYLPWTAMNHHVVTFRLNVNLKNQREMRK